MLRADPPGVLTAGRGCPVGGKPRLQVQEPRPRPQSQAGGSPAMGWDMEEVTLEAKGRSEAHSPLTPHPASHRPQWAHPAHRRKATRGGGGEGPQGRTCGWHGTLTAASPPAWGRLASPLDTQRRSSPTTTLGIRSCRGPGDEAPPSPCRGRGADPGSSRGPPQTGVDRKAGAEPCLRSGPRLTGGPHPSCT